MVWCLVFGCILGGSCLEDKEEVAVSAPIV